MVACVKESRCCSLKLSPEWFISEPFPDTPPPRGVGQGIVVMSGDAPEGPRPPGVGHGIAVMSGDAPEGQQQAFQLQMVQSRTLSCVGFS